MYEVPWLDHHAGLTKLGSNRNNGNDAIVKSGVIQPVIDSPKTVERRYRLT